MSTFDSTVNSGAAYVVNDVYKRYLRPDAPAKTYVYFSYGASIGLVAIAIVVGLTIESIHEITTWITFALYGGYVAPNLLKWHWWRFNGHGYFAGMIAGVAVAILIQLPKTLNMLAGTQLWEFPGLYAFFLTAPVSAIASIVVCLLTPPESDDVLMSFYRDVRPWGFWRPIYEKLRRQDPQLQPNRDFWMDAFNVANGILWQLSLMVVPICLVIRKWDTLWLFILVLTGTSVVMKFTWWDRLARTA